MVCFFVTGLNIPWSQAQEYSLPAPGVMVRLSPPLNPPMLKGIKVHSDNPFRFEFILDKGDSDSVIPSSKSNVIPAKAGIQQQEQLKTEATKLIKYFLASLTIPEKDLWVNLSPYEKDRIIPQSFGLTEMGRDLLAEDYMLKQITASLIYPEDAIGKKFWKRIYAEAQQKFGTTDIPVNTFNKVWIVPEKAVVYENAKAGTAYVVESKLKVMLEQDYLSMEKHQGQPGGMALAVSPSTLPTPQLLNTKAPQGKNHSTNEDVNAKNALPLDSRYETASIGANIVREIVIPELTKEVNENKNFAQLRQVYNSLILAIWYKKKIKDNILAQVYADKNKIKGLSFPNASAHGRESRDSGIGNPEYIYQQYLQAFKKGVYSYIKEDTDPMTNETLPRKYFSGGVNMGGGATDVSIENKLDIREVNRKNFAMLGIIKKTMFILAISLLTANQNIQAQTLQVNKDQHSSNTIMPQAILQGQETFDELVSSLRQKYFYQIEGTNNTEINNKDIIVLLNQIANNPAVPAVDQQKAIRAIEIYYTKVISTVRLDEDHFFKFKYDEKIDSQVLKLIATRSENMNLRGWALYDIAAQYGDIRNEIKNGGLDDVIIRDVGKEIFDRIKWFYSPIVQDFDKEFNELNDQKGENSLITKEGWKANQDARVVAAHMEVKYLLTIAAQSTDLVAYEKKVAQLLNLGLVRMAGFVDEQTRDELVNNRLQQESNKIKLFQGLSFENDPRPIAVMALSKSDWNRTFINMNLHIPYLDRLGVPKTWSDPQFNVAASLIKQGFRMMYYDVDEFAEGKSAIKAIQDAGQFKRVQYVEIGAHGTPTSLRYKTMVDFFSEDNIKKWRQELAGFVEPGADVIVDGCSTGELHSGQANIADVFQKIIPEGNVMAPMGILWEIKFNPSKKLGEGRIIFFRTEDLNDGKQFPIYVPKLKGSITNKIKDETNLIFPRESGQANRLKMAANDSAMLNKKDNKNTIKQRIFYLLLAAAVSGLLGILYTESYFDAKQGKLRRDMADFQQRTTKINYLEDSISTNYDNPTAITNFYQAGEGFKKAAAKYGPEFHKSSGIVLSNIDLFLSIIVLQREHIGAVLKIKELENEAKRLEEEKLKIGSIIALVDKLNEKNFKMEEESRKLEEDNHKIEGEIAAQKRAEQIMTNMITIHNDLQGFIIDFKPPLV